MSELTFSMVGCTFLSPDFTYASPISDCATLLSGWPSFADDARGRACVRVGVHPRAERCRPTVPYDEDGSTTAAEARRKRHATEIRHLWTSPRWEWHRRRHMHAAPWFVFTSPSDQWARAWPPGLGPTEEALAAGATVTVTSHAVLSRGAQLALAAGLPRRELRPAWVSEAGLGCLRSRL